MNNFSIKKLSEMQKTVLMLVIGVLYTIIATFPHFLFKYDDLWTILLSILIAFTIIVYSLYTIVNNKSKNSFILFVYSSTNVILGLIILLLQLIPYFLNSFLIFAIWSVIKIFLLLLIIYFNNENLFKKIIKITILLLIAIYSITIFNRSSPRNDIITQNDIIALTTYIYSSMTAFVGLFICYKATTNAEAIRVNFKVLVFYYLVTLLSLVFFAKDFLFLFIIIIWVIG